MCLAEEYTTEILTAEISTADYIREFQDVWRFEQLCRQCPNYGMRWGCPPLSEELYRQYLNFPQLKIIANKLTPLESGLPLSASYKFLNSERRRLEPQILAEEQQIGGRATLFTGVCFHCKECARPAGQPCRHPQWVRPSLEALGFDLNATAQRLLHTEILWGKEGKMPPYLLLIGGIFHM